MTAPPDPGGWVWLARIRRTQGRKGEVFADILTDFPEKFAQRRHLWLLPVSASGQEFTRAESPAEPSGDVASAPPRAVVLLNHWLHKGGVVLHFAGMESISDAEALTGMAVVIPRSERAVLPEDEVYIADLIGCTLVDVSDEAPCELGQIKNVDRTAGPVPLLIVNGPKGEILIPFAQPYLRQLDLEHRRVEMALPEGLADLNA